MASISALVYNKINDDIATPQSSVTFRTVGNSFAAREWFAVELTNNGGEPIYYFNSHCECITKILKRGLVGFEEPKYCLECLAPRQGELLNPGEKVILYQNIGVIGTYKIRIGYGATNDLSSATNSIETNEFEITQNDCPSEANTNLCPRNRGMYQIPPNCEYQACIDF